MRVFLVLMILSLVSCSFYHVEKEVQTTYPAIKPTLALIPSEQLAFTVEVWVDNLAPERGARVMLFGSLIKHGVRLGGMMMNAYWPEDGRHPRVPNCKVQVIYGSGVCIVETQDFNVGVPVLLRVEFDYEGKTYSGSIEIIPN